MALEEKNLYIKRSTLPGAGKGLFTKTPITKGTRIVEYKGKVLTWREVQKMPDYRNGYVFYFSSKYVLDAWKHKGFAHFANDAKGINRIEGIRNNAEYITEKRHCYIMASRDIPAHSEILVGYGGEYWQTIRYNLRVDRQSEEKAGKKSSRVALPHHHSIKRRSKNKLDPNLLP